MCLWLKDQIAEKKSLTLSTFTPQQSGQIDLASCRMQLQKFRVILFQTSYFMITVRYITL